MQEVTEALELLLHMVVVLSEGNKPDRGDMQRVRDAITVMRLQGLGDYKP